MSRAILSDLGADAMRPVIARHARAWRGPLRAEAATFRPAIAPGARRALWTGTFTISAIPVVSQAAMNGVPLPVVIRLLWHSHVRMTMRYTSG